MFLFCLERLKSSRYLIGSRVTKAGLARFLFENRPRVLLLDEIDKMDAEHYGILLSLCESGRVTEMLFGRESEITLNITVFACCNRVDKIPEEVMSRFEIIEFEKYTTDEFIHIVKNLLIRRQKSPEFAQYIAESAAKELKTTDVREAVRIAKLCQTKEEVDEHINIIKKYRKLPK